MSEGPIKRERLATTFPAVSIPDSQRICARRPGVQLVSECGRRGSAIAATPLQVVTCPECLAAIRADAEAARG